MSIKQWIRRRNRSRSSISMTLFVIAALIVLSFLLFISNFHWSSGSYQAKNTVEQFYQFEQGGNYGSAWELLHSSMKEHFSKEQFIQIRTQIYMQQLRASTFQFEVGKVKKVGTWSMTEGSPAINHVYRTTVTQHFLSIFGEMSIHQDVYAVKESHGWGLLWSYNKLQK